MIYRPHSNPPLLDEQGVYASVYYGGRIYVLVRHSPHGRNYKRKDSSLVVNAACPELVEGVRRVDPMCTELQMRPAMAGTKKKATCNRLRTDATAHREYGPYEEGRKIQERNIDLLRNIATLSEALIVRV